MNLKAAHLLGRWPRASTRRIAPAPASDPDFGFRVLENLNFKSLEFRVLGLGV